jgi:hypothetical protein
MQARSSPALAADACLRLSKKLSFTARTSRNQNSIQRHDLFGNGHGDAQLFLPFSDLINEMSFLFLLLVTASGRSSIAEKEIAV